MKRGALSAAGDAIASPTFQQSWTLDARGNQASTTTNGSTVSRTFNKSNETATVGGSAAAAPTYDAAGNTTAKDGRTYVYDAWNRLKQVKSGATTLASYAYDALRRRVVETSAGVTTDVYFGGSTPIEERVGSFGYRHVIGVAGDVVLRDVYEDIAGSPRSDWRYFAQQDADGDVVALVSPAGNVAERYAYAPYGAVSILDAAGAAKASSGLLWRQLFQGGRYDSATGLYVFGFRDYDPSAGAWMQRDPVGLAGGDLNLYRFVGNNPVNYIDPTGLAGYWAGGGYNPYNWPGYALDWWYENDKPTDPVPPSVVPSTPKPSQKFGDQPEDDFSRRYGGSGAAGNYPRSGDIPTNNAWRESGSLIKKLFDQIRDTLIDRATDALPCKLLVGGPLAAMSLPMGTRRWRRVPNPGGRLGSPEVRQQIYDIGTMLIDAGFEITNGGGRAPEEYFPGPGAGRLRHDG